MLIGTAALMCTIVLTRSLQFVVIVTLTHGAVINVPCYTSMHATALGGHFVPLMLHLRALLCCCCDVHNKRKCEQKCSIKSPLDHFFFFFPPD